MIWGRYSSECGDSEGEWSSEGGGGGGLWGFVLFKGAWMEC